MAAALDYMALEAGRPIREICSTRPSSDPANGRIEDLRAAAAVARGRHVAPSIRQALVVPGSGPAASVPFPKWLGMSEEYAKLVLAIVEND